MSNKRQVAVGDVFEVDIPMRWSDADMLQHMNNAVYFRFMEEARILMMAQAGMNSTDDVGKVVAHCACDFKKAITYPATVRVKLVVEKVGRTSLTQRNELSVLHDLTSGPYAVGTTVLVNIHHASGKAIPWTEYDLAMLGSVCQPND